MKKLISCVLPGVLLTLANDLEPEIRFKQLDLPEFDRPMKATSGIASFGHSSRLDALVRNVADSPAGLVIALGSLNFATDEEYDLSMDYVCVRYWSGELVHLLHPRCQNDKDQPEQSNIDIKSNASQ